MAKVAILYEVLGRSRGGIEAWIYHASEELLKQGHSVTLINTQENETPEDAAPAGVILKSLKRKKLSPSVFLLRALYNTKKQLELKEYDIIWARSFIMAWAASKLVTSQSVIYINAAPYSYYAFRPFIHHLKNNKSFKGFFYAISFQLSYIFAWFFERNAISNCQNVYLSEKRKEQTISFFRLKESKGSFKTVAPGVNTTKFQPKIDKKKSDKKLRIISVCRLEKDKNIQCILKAINSLGSLKSQIEFTIVGEGSFMKDLMDLSNSLNLNETVSFAGRQSNVEEWYSKNDVFILPSLYEGFGSVYIEAMACGLPCIAISNKSGKYSVASDEIITHKTDGFLLKENDHKELASHISTLLKSRIIIDKMSHNARKKVMSNFSWEKSISKLIKLSQK